MIDLSEEAEDAPWLLRNTVVRPAQVMEVPNFASLFGLQEDGEEKKKKTECNNEDGLVVALSPVFRRYHVFWSHLQNFDCIVGCFSL